MKLFLSMIFGSMLNVVKSREKMFFVISTWTFSRTLPALTFVIVCVRTRRPDLSSVVVIPFFSPRYRLPSIFFSPLFVWNIDSIM